MSGEKHKDSAFVRGQAAGSDYAGPVIANPFEDGSVEHNNFEVGRRFGASNFERLRSYEATPAATQLSARA